MTVVMMAGREKYSVTECVCVGEKKILGASVAVARSRKKIATQVPGIFGWIARE
jgi:hypothetical protein